MRPHLLVLAIAACGHTAAPTPVPPHRAPPTRPPPPAVVAKPIDPRLAAVDPATLPESDGVEQTPGDDAILIPPGGSLVAAVARPAGSQVYLAARHGDRPMWIRARALEEPRCVAWLAATGATLADVARAIGPDAEGVGYAVDTDSRVCGGSWPLRLDALRKGGGSLFVRSDAEGKPACSKLSFSADGHVVREGAPRLVFDLKSTDDTIEIAPVAQDAGLLRCTEKLAISGEDASSIDGAFTYPYVMSTGIHATESLYYTEAACLAGAAPRDNAPSCLHALVAATSTRADGVIDRVAPIAAKHGALYPARDCKPVRFGQAKLDEPVYDGTIDTTYDGLSIRAETTRWSRGGCTKQGCYGVDDTEAYDDVMPVIQTAGDYVLVGGARWYLTKRACKAAR